MMNTDAVRRSSARFNLGFLMRQARGRAAAVAAVAGLVWLGACESRPLNPSPSPDADTTSCANVGCAAPPLCSAGCQATCGCCSCTPGERSGDLVCTSAGCYAPVQVADAGTDAGAIVCSLPFEVGPCDALFPVYAYVNGACVARTYGGCEGNGNRFNTVEECMATCEGRPVPNGCPAGRIAKEICLGCGPAGGCSKSQTVCALVCDVDVGTDACSMSLLVCSQGVCQYAFCH